MRERFLPHGLMLAVLAAGPLGAQVSQNPSPMVDHARAHGRIPKTEPQGQRWKLSLGTLLVSQGAEHRPRLPLIVHFHGAAWLAESSALRRMRRFRP